MASKIRAPNELKSRGSALQNWVEREGLHKVGR